MVTLSHSLLYLKEAIVRIQGVGQDIVSAVHSVMECCRELKGVRNDVDGFSNRIFQHSSRIAEISGISVSMPHVSRCHTINLIQSLHQWKNISRKSLLFHFLIT